MWPCPDCGGARDFVQPVCVDGHAEAGVECPEWACVECGTAIVIGWFAVDAPAPAARRRSHAA